MATRRKDDPEELGDERTAALLGPTPATYSYNDALLMGRMTEAELAKVKLELFGDEIVEVEEVPPPPPKASRSIPPPLPPEAKQGSKATKGKPPPLPPEARRSVPPPAPAAAQNKPASAQAKPPAPTSTSAAVAAPASKPPSPPPRPVSTPAHVAAPANAPSPDSTPAPPRRPPPLPPQTVPQRLKAMIAEYDYSGALALAERELLATPESAELQRVAESCRTAIARVYLAQLGRRSDIPRIIMGGAELRGLALDRWAAFVMSRVDGESSIEDILDMAGMAELDALRILYELKQRGVVGIREAHASRTP